MSSIVVTTKDVKIGEQCPILFRGSEAECVEWIGRQSDAAEGNYQIDIAAPIELDSFTRAYLECALWSSIDDDSEPFDSNYGIGDLAPEAIELAKRDCEAFQAANQVDIDAGWTYENVQHSSSELAGHDFWLTRNGHGAGFWDGDWPEPAATRLTEASKAAGERDLYVGDDGLIYFFGG